MDAATAQPTELRELGEAVAFFGAPLAGRLQALSHWKFEETVARALAAAHSEAQFLRTLPLILLRQRARLNFEVLATAAERRSPKAARAWALYLNMPEDSFRALLGKFGA